jgi:hypothetical protein
LKILAIFNVVRFLFITVRSVHIREQFNHYPSIKYYEGLLKLFLFPKLMERDLKEYQMEIKFLKKSMALLTLSSFISISTHAELHLRQGGFVYDDVLNITWMQPSGLVAPNASGPYRTANDAFGTMDWANNLSVEDPLRETTWEDWRLPSFSLSASDGVGRKGGQRAYTYVDCSTATEVECRDNEMGYMYHKNGISVANPGPFAGIQAGKMWSGTEGTPSIKVWFFDYGTGLPGYADQNRAGMGWAVRDGDVGEAQEGDEDEDGIFDSADNCVSDFNPLQENSDGDTEGDVCDNDDDNDSVADSADNCPLISNIFQEDSDFDNMGDACDNNYDAGSVAQHVDDEAVAIVSILTAINVSGGNGIISKLTGNGSVTQKVSDAVITYSVTGDLESYLSDLSSALSQLDATKNQVDAKANKKKGISDPELTQIYDGINEIRSTIEGLILEADGIL